jgi:hypothetical protein
MYTYYLDGFQASKMVRSQSAKFSVDLPISTANRELVPKFQDALQASKGSNNEFSFLPL